MNDAGEAIVDTTVKLNKAHGKREGNTSSLVYERLRSEIMSGKLMPGSPLSQLTIAKENGTSRGPVREAMSRLQQDQLIVGIANHRFNVAPFDISDLEAVLGLHLVNMAFAIRVSVPLLSEHDIACLERYCEIMERAVDGDREAWESAYRDFALIITKHAGERVVSLILGLIDNIQRYRANLLDRFPRVYVGGTNLKKIMMAVNATDGALAAKHYADFFGRISSLILAGAAPQYDTARLRSYMAGLSTST